MSFLRETDFEEIRVENAFGDLYQESDEESESGDQLGVGLKMVRCFEGQINFDDQHIF